MKYIINLIISFNPNDRKLYIYNDERIFIELSKPAARLLLELIKNNQFNISREELLNNVWINYGFTASNAGLNNYISELRKSFVTLEMNREIIITIPKVGFRMDADIQSIIDSNPAETPEWQTGKEPENQEPLPQQDENLEVSEQKTSPLERLKKTLSVFQQKNKKVITKVKILLFILLALLIITLAIQPKNEAPVVFLYNDGECKVSTIGKDKGTDDIEIRAKLQISKLNIGCNDTKRDIFYHEELPGNDGRNRVLITVCNLINNDNYSSCKNFKVNQGNIK